MNDPRLTLAQVAELVGGRVRGDGAMEIRGIATLQDAGSSQLALLADRRYLDQVEGSSAAALFTAQDLVDDVPESWSLVVVEDAHAALVPLLNELFPARDREAGVHPTAVLGRGVEMGADVAVGPYAVVEDGASLGDRCSIGAHTVVGRGCRVGEDALLHPHVVLYPGTTLGRRVIVHAGARLGVDGFGYAMVDGTFTKVPQVGRCVVEDDVEIGAGTCLDRGSIGETRVGAGTKLDNLIHLAHNVRVGSGCAMAAQVGIAGSSQVGTGVMLGGQVGVAGHLHVGDGAMVAAQAGLAGDVDAGATVMGYPARPRQEYLRGYALMMRLPDLVRRVKKLERLVEGASEGAPE